MLVCFLAVVRVSDVPFCHFFLAALELSCHDVNFLGGFRFGVLRFCLEVFYFCLGARRFRFEVRDPVTGFGARIYRAVNVFAMRICGCAEEAELGNRPCWSSPRGACKGLQNER
jgi:hypothetical protein